MPHSFVGRTPQSAVDPPVGLFGKNGIPGFQAKPVGGPAADPGVRPTKLCGIGLLQVTRIVDHQCCRSAGPTGETVTR
jgi:hypothetical protein